MDKNDKLERKKNPRETANIFSALTYIWVAKIFRLGYTRDLELDDLYKPLKEHKSSIIGDKLSIAWKNQLESYKKNRSAPSLTRALLKVFGLRIALYGLFQFISEVIVRSLQPFILGRFLRYFVDDNITKTEAFLYATALILAGIIYILISHADALASYHMGMKCRVACCSLVYRKALKLSKTSVDETTIGQAVNLISNDVSRFDIAALTGLHYLWVGPLQTILTTYFMYSEVGLPAIYGITVLLMSIPLQIWLGKKTSCLRLRTAIRTDDRVRLTNESIRGIQAIKMYTWEYFFRDIVKIARNKEISVISGGKISAENVFMLTAFYANLQQTMAMFFPHDITKLAELNVSINRLQHFLMRDEIKLNKIENNMKNSNEIQNNITNERNDESSIIFDNVYAKWLDSNQDNVLNGISVNIKSGEFVAIIGKVGAGKSSLLNVILKELPVKSGKLIVPYKLSYTSQEPWLFSGSVQQNIIFGREMDYQKYQRVIEVCELKRDFRVLPYGDRTIIGERGISLSGGQKARINLARAVYSDSQIYLFDDPLSAVDVHVGKNLFKKCFEKYLHGRTRILVTHQIQLLRNVDKIIVLDRGSVIATGTYDEIMNMGMDIASLYQQTSHEKADECVLDNRSIISFESFPSNGTTTQKEDEPKEVEETRTRGNIKSGIYISYLKVGGNYAVIFIIMLLHIILQICASGSDWFLSFWIVVENNYQTTLNTDMINNTSSLDRFNEIILSRNTCIYIFSGLIILTIFFSIIRSLALFEICLRTSKRLHDAMFYCIIRATMHFLNTNTSARILNRFTKDMGTIDELLPVVFADCIQIGLGVLGIVIVVSISNPWLLIPTFIISVILYILRIIYVTTSRSVKRLEGVTRSPIYNHFSATLQGLTTIRSFGANEILTEEFDRHQDVHSSAWYLFITTSRAFAFWLDLIGVLYTMVVTLSFLILPKNSKFSQGANVGLAITQCFGLTNELQWGLRQSAELENQMISVERIIEYTKIESEPPLESSSDKKPSNDWPIKPKIEFKDVYLSYGPVESPVLKNICMTIEPRERVGIIGRTGAGKSSIIAALFRIADVKGIIKIDGIDTSQIGLHDLRSKISIIPQEPFLFSGTLRKNLDPFEKYDDSVLWAALKDVKLGEIGLETDINDGGSNLSVGQRQLVCLARAIVEKNNILVLDEATANIDSLTDEFIQLTIREKFSNCTLLTIAHRLNTVIDNDKILVIDNGRIVEFDHPYILLQNENSFLSGMVMKTGKVMSEILRVIAKNNYEKHQLN